MEWKAEAKRAFLEFKDVFLFPLISGIMFGVGTVAGKRIAEAWMSLSQSTSSPMILTQ